MLIVTYEPQMKMNGVTWLYIPHFLEGISMHGLSAITMWVLFKLGSVWDNIQGPLKGTTLW